MNSPAATIEVSLEGRPQRVLEGTTLAALVAALGHAPSAVTTAVNGEFVRRDLRDARELQPGDSVLLFQPIVGG
jgi:sulfur carrier protein